MNRFVAERGARYGSSSEKAIWLIWEYGIKRRATDLMLMAEPIAQEPCGLGVMEITDDELSLNAGIFSNFDVNLDGPVVSLRGPLTNVDKRSGHLREIMDWVNNIGRWKADIQMFISGDLIEGTNGYQINWTFSTDADAVQFKLRWGDTVLI